MDNILQTIHRYYSFLFIIDKQISSLKGFIKEIC